MGKTYEKYLMFYFGMVLSITLILFSTILYVFMSNRLYKALDDSLLSLANTEAGAALEMEVETDNHEEGHKEIPHIHISPFDFKAYGISDRYVRLFTPAGKIIDSYPEELPFAMTSSPAVLKKLKKGDHHFETVSRSENPLRTLYLPIVEDEKITYIIQVGSHLTTIQGTQKRLQLILFSLNVIVIFISLITSRFLAKKAVAPMKVISSTARKIDENNLDQQVDIFSPFVEVNELVDILNAMLRRIRKSFNSQKEFIANVSHEMQSPLTIIKGSIDVTLRKERPVSEYISVLKDAAEEATKMSNLVTDLLVLARIDEKSSALSQSLFSLNELIGEVIRVKQEMAIDKGVTISCEAVDHIELQADREMVKRVVYNLLDNAIKYSFAGGKNIISLIRKPGIVAIEIKDSGIGISEDDIVTIFDRFFRVDRSRSRNTGGTGLGLAIVKEIVEAHKGSISVESKPGFGSTFTCIFPQYR